MKTKEILKKLQDMSASIMCESDRYSKKDALREFRNMPEVRRVLQLMYDPFTRFNISSSKIEKALAENTLSMIRTPMDIVTLLEDLALGAILRGDEASRVCVQFCLQYPEYNEIFFRIIDKDLSCGIGAKTINEVFPGLIPEFKERVPLAKPYKDNLCNFADERWYASRKMDGVRCLAFLNEDHSVKFLSRNGNELYTLGKLRKDIQKFWGGPWGVILDGELCVVDEDGLESFSGVTSMFRRKDYTIDKPVFKVFDMYCISRFEGDEEYMSSMEPFQYTYDLLQVCTEKLERIQLLPQTLIEDTGHFGELCAHIPPEWEGLILRKDDVTQFRRSANLLKVKKFMDDEYEVIGVEKGRKVIDGRERDTCASLLIKHKDYVVKVGSGLSDKDRLKWYKDPSQIIGKTITVKYFAESRNKSGEISLRFPTLKHVWEGEKE